MPTVRPFDPSILKSRNLIPSDERTTNSISLEEPLTNLGGFFVLRSLSIFLTSSLPPFVIMSIFSRETCPDAFLAGIGIVAGNDCVNKGPFTSPYTLISFVALNGNYVRAHHL